MAQYGLETETTTHLKGMSFGDSSGNGGVNFREEQIVLWESNVAPSMSDYPNGGIFMMDAFCIQISPAARKGTLWHMVVDGNQSHFNEIDPPVLKIAVES